MFQRFMRMCSMILVIILLVNMLPVSALNATLGNPQEIVITEPLNPQEVTKEMAEEDIEVTILGELTDKRTEYTKQYLLSDGTFMAAVYADAVHYEKNGAWEEIDNTLKSVAGAYTTTAGDWTVSFPQQLSSAKDITITKDGYTLSFGMDGRLNQSSGAVVASAGEMVSVNAVGGAAETFAVASAQTSVALKQPVDLSEAKAAAKFEQLVQDKLYSKLTYANVYANTDIVYDLQSNKVKESVIISKYDSTLRGYRYTLNTGGMIPVLDETGHIEFYDPDMENIVMTMPAPFLQDANGAYNFDIQVQLTGSGSIYTLTYLLPQQWLADSQRAYPVVLDPVVSAGTGVNNIADQTVFSIGSKSYTWIVVECGYDVNMGKERFFMAFNSLPTLTSSDVIVDAQVSLYKPYTSSNPFYVGVHSVANTWTSSSITWSNMPSTGSNAEDFNMVTSPTWYSWNVTNLARSWYQTGVNTGMMFKADDEVEAAAVNHWSQFYSSDNGSYSPTLTIEYENPTSLSLGNSVAVSTSVAEEKQVFTFTPTTTGTYIIQSSNATGDPKVWLYNSSFTQIGSNDDSGGNRNFRLSVNLTAYQTYYIEAGHYGTSTGSYNLTILKPADVDAEIYHVYNEGTAKFLDIHGPGEQIYVHQWTTSTGEQQKWLFEKQADGYYTIRSEYGNNYYVGISSTNTNENNIQLFSAISNSTRWNIYINAVGKYILEPKTALGKAVCAPNSSTGTEMQLVWLGSNSNSNHLWSLGVVDDTVIEDDEDDHVHFYEIQSSNTSSHPHETISECECGATRVSYPLRNNCAQCTAGAIALDNTIFEAVVFSGIEGGNGILITPFYTIECYIDYQNYYSHPFSMIDYGYPSFASFASSVYAYAEVPPEYPSVNCYPGLEVSYYSYADTLLEKQSMAWHVTNVNMAHPSNTSIVFTLENNPQYALSKATFSMPQTGYSKVVEGKSYFD